MIEAGVRGALVLLAGYLGLGLAAAVALHARGLVRIDPGVAGTGWAFRALITPGILALWPLLLFRWLRSRDGVPAAGAVDRPLGPRAVRGMHRRLVAVLLVVLPAVALAAIVLRPGDPSRAALPALGATPCADLPEIALDVPAPFASRPLALRMRRGSGRAQLEIDVRGDLGLPAPALLWEPADGTAQRFLARTGSVGRHCVEVGPDLLDSGGAFVLYALGHGESVARFEVAPARGGKRGP